MTESFDDTIELVRDAQKGEGASLAAIVDRYREVLLQRIRLIMGPEARQAAESDDFLQGLFLEIVSDFEKRCPRDEKEFLRWATAIARNNIRDGVRRRREIAVDRFASSLDWRPVLGNASVGSPAENAEREEQVERLCEAMAALREEDRLAIELRHFEGLSFAEIGQRLGRTENAAQLLHTRALVKLGSALRARM
ncbi:MAG: RNA polymerase sigma factor [Planctomycetota bacterium]